MNNPDYIHQFEVITINGYNLIYAKLNVPQYLIFVNK